MSRTNRSWPAMGSEPAAAVAWTMKPWTSPPPQRHVLGLEDVALLPLGALPAVAPVEAIVGRVEAGQGDALLPHPLQRHPQQPADVALPAVLREAGHRADGAIPHCAAVDVPRRRDGAHVGDE